MHLDRYRRLRLMLVAAVCAAAAATGIVLETTGSLRSMELATVDTRFRLRGAQEQPREVAVVDIDDESLAELGARWPLPRSLHAGAIDRLAAAGAATIVYDVAFLEAGDQREDADLRRAIASAGNVVLATPETTADGSTTLLGADRAAIEALGATLGSTRAPPDPGGVIRRLAPRVAGFDALAVAAAERRLGRPVPAPAGDAWIDYAGPAGTVRTVRFADLLAGRAAPGALRGRVVVVGPSAGGVGDLFPTPVAQDEFMAGAEIHANAARTALRGFPLADAPGVVGVLLVLAAAAVPAVAGLHRRWSAGAAAVALAAAALAGGAQLAFQAGTIVPVVVPAATLALAAGAALAARALTGALHRQHMRDVFGRFVGDSVVEQALAQADPDLRLGGRELDATVLFSDLRGFTSFSETLPPERVIGVLNRYLESMSDAILEHGGTLVSYMGDGIMAVFGAPVAQPDHAERALAAARDMSGPRLEGFNAWLEADGIDRPFAMGIGVNSGPVLSGNVGSARRLEYTAIGDTTNTAARLEAMTKDTPHSVFVAESTRSRLASQDGLAYVDELPVRGREAPVRVWALSRS